jgi:hypothetical protein
MSSRTVSTSAQRPPSWRPSKAKPGSSANQFAPERIGQIKSLVERGRSREQIAEIIGCTVGSLVVTCSRIGVSLRPPTKATPNRQKPELAPEDLPGDTPQEQWQRSVGNMAGEAVSLEAFWTKTFGKEWEGFDVPSDLVTLAREAADAWTQIANKLTTRAEIPHVSTRTDSAKERKAAPPPTPPADDGLDIPDYLDRRRNGAAS